MALIPFPGWAVISLNASLVVSGWGQEVTNSGTITGPAPLAVFFDATGTTSVGYEAFREAGYNFDFGYVTPTTPGTWTYSGKPKGNQVGGPMASHVYETPGTYTASVRAQLPSGTYQDRFVTVVVQDPAVVYAGAATVCVSLAGNFSGAPAGATTTTTVPTSSTINSNTRYLFRCGEDYSATTIFPAHSKNNIQISAYGSGAKPIVKLRMNNTPPVIGQFRQNSITIYDVYDAISMQTEFADYVTWLRVETFGNEGLLNTLINYSYNNPIANQDMSLCTWPKNIVSQECFFDYNLTLYNVFFCGTRSSFQGNNMVNASGISCRIWLSYKNFVAHNQFSVTNTNNTKSQLKMHSSGPDAFTYDLSVTQTPMSQYVIAADNYVPPDDNNWQLAYEPQDSQSNEVCQDGIFERNVFGSLPTALGSQRAEISGGNRICYRDSIVAPRPATNNIAVNGQSGSLLVVGPDYVPVGNSLIDNIQVFPNTPTVIPSKAGT